MLSKAYTVLESLNLSEILSYLFFFLNRSPLAMFVILNGNVKFTYSQTPLNVADLGQFRDCST